LPEGGLDRFFALRLITKPVRVTDTIQVRDALPTIEYSLMLYRIGDRVPMLADDTNARQFGLKGGWG
jgi:hypothetical protein